MALWKKIKKFSFPHSQSTLKYGSENRPWVRGLISGYVAVPPYDIHILSVDSLPGTEEIGQLPAVLQRVGNLKGFYWDYDTQNYS